MKLQIKEIDIDAPFGFVSPKDFPHKETIYPFRLKVGNEEDFFRIQAYYFEKWLEKGEIGISKIILDQNEYTDGSTVEVEIERSYDPDVHRLIIDKVEGKKFVKEDLDKITGGFMHNAIAPQHSSAFVLSQHFTQWDPDEIQAMARSFAEKDL
jgi:hypothetical protein